MSRQTGTYQVLQQALRHDPAAHLSYAAGDDMTGTPVPASALTHNGQPGLLRTNTSDATTAVVPQLDNTRWRTGRRCPPDRPGPGPAT